MIVRVTTGKDVQGAVRYNEQKVGVDDAEVLAVINFSHSQAENQSSLRSKELKHLAGLNKKIQQPGIHFSLSYHPSEKPTDEAMRILATDFMNQMGYAEQPYVVYRHDDRPHPHLHIVSVQVDQEGRRLSDSHLKRRCNTARQQLEKTYGLVKAQDQERHQKPDVLPNLERIHYESGNLKQGVATLVRTAFSDFYFSSFSEYSDLLRHYGIHAHQQNGKNAQGTDWKGITYQVITGDVVESPPFKASSFSFKPTSGRLTNRFQEGAKRKKAHRTSLTDRVKKATAAYSSLSEADFLNALRSERIQVIVPEGERSNTYLYIDLHYRTVFREEELGEAFKKQNLSARFRETELKPVPTPALVTDPIPISGMKGTEVTAEKVKAGRSESSSPSIAWNKVISRVYQSYRQQEKVYFESTLIASFPFTELLDALLAQRYRKEEAAAALRQFEAYKKEQLPQIQAKEQAYFQQSVGSLLGLALQSKLDGPGRVSFLKANGFVLDALPTGVAVIRHQHGSHLELPLTNEQFGALTQASGSSLPLSRPFSKAERDTYLAIARNIPIQTTFYDLNPYLLKRILPEALHIQASEVLNRNYLTTLLASKDRLAGDLSAALFNRGIIIKRNGDAWQVGFHTTPESSYVNLPDSLSSFLNTKEKEIDTPDSQRSRLDSAEGRKLIALWQGNDLGDRARIDWAMKAIETLIPTLKGQPFEEQLVNLAHAVKTQSPRRVTAPVRVENKQDRLPEEVRTLFWKTYFSYRRKAQYAYESTLLRNPAQLPLSELITALVQHDKRISLSEAKAYAENFFMGRQQRYNQILAADKTHFDRVSNGFLSMLIQAPVSPMDRVKLLRALYLTVERTPEGQIELVHEQDKSLRNRLSPEETTALFSQPDKAQWVAKPAVEMPRKERALYEQLLFGSTLRPGLKNQTEQEDQSTLPKQSSTLSAKKDGAGEAITWNQINPDRVKTLLTSDQFDKASTQLNEASVKALMERMPVVLTDALPWLQQRGYVLDKTPAGNFRLGYHLSDRETFTPVSPGLNRLLENAQAGGKYRVPTFEESMAWNQPLPHPRTGIVDRSPALVRNLAAALDTGRLGPVNYTITQILKANPSLKTLSTQPEQLLDVFWKQTLTRPEPIEKEISQKAHSVDGESLLPNAEPSGLGQALSTDETRRKRKAGEMTTRRRKQGL